MVLFADAFRAERASEADEWQMDVQQRFFRCPDATRRQAAVGDVVVRRSQFVDVEIGRVVRAGHLRLIWCRRVAQRVPLHAGEPGVRLELFKALEARVLIADQIRN